jgi:hypothetical protein
MIYFYARIEIMKAYLSRNHTNDLILISTKCYTQKTDFFIKEQLLKYNRFFHKILKVFY